MNKIIVFFDVNGTLLNDTNSPERMAIPEAIRRVYKKEPNLSVWESSDGKTDFRITHELLNHLKLNSEVSEKFNEFKTEYFQLMKSFLKSSADIVVSPGVRSFLQDLKERNHILTGILTGSLEEIVRYKLRLVELESFFPLHIYGETYFFHQELASVALKKLSTQLMVKIVPGKNVIMIGNTIYNVETARFIGAKSLILCSNPNKMNDLENIQPDFISSSFLEKATWLNQIP